MIVLEGRGQGTKPVLARAALLIEEERTGRLTFAEELLSAAGRQVKRNDEPLEIALVARDAENALLLRLPAGLVLVAVISEEVYLPRYTVRDTDQIQKDRREQIAVLSGIPNVLEMVPEGVGIIVDPLRGRALIEPDVEEIARVQALETQRPRLLLGAANTPAQTQSGLVIPVWCAVDDDCFEEAVLSGADGVLLTDSGEDVPLSRLRLAAEAVGGGDIVLSSDFEAVEIPDLLIAAAQCNLRWLLNPKTLPLPIEELRAELMAQVQEEQVADRPAAMPLLSATLSSNDTDPNRTKGYDEVVLLGDGVVNTMRLPPLRVWLREIGDENDLRERVESAVAIGACGMIVPAEWIESVKNCIRELP